MYESRNGKGGLLPFMRLLQASWKAGWGCGQENGRRGDHFRHMGVGQGPGMEERQSV